MSERHEIYAVHKNSLEELLESLNLLKELEEGKLFCRFCKKTITLENLQVVYPKDDEIVICCNDIKCFQSVLLDSESIGDIR
jgi:hypothetical protein